MNLSRRKFLAQSSLAAASLTVGKELLATPATDTKKIGIQLYSVKEDMVADAKSTLKKIASFGYNQLESYERGETKDFFWGIGNKGFNSFINDLGMTIISSHCNIDNDFERKASEAAAIGMKYLICPYIGPQKSADDYKLFADKFNARGEICKRNGIRFAYHNHQYSFVPTNDKLGQNIMIENTDPALVDFELDLYWISVAGYDPVAYLNKYKNRIKLVHVKDRGKDYAPSGKLESIDLGTGTIPYKNILPVAANTGVEYFFVEQEYFWNGTPLTSAAANAGYMKKRK